MKPFRFTCQHRPRWSLCCQLTLRSRIEHKEIPDFLCKLLRNFVTYRYECDVFVDGCGTGAGKGFISVTEPASSKNGLASFL